MHSDGIDTEGEGNSKQTPRSRTKLSEQDLQDLHPHLRSKYLAVRRHMTVLYSILLLVNDFKFKIKVELEPEL